MRKLAYTAVIIAAVALALAMLAKFTGGRILGFRLSGLLNGATVLLLFGINLTLFELLDKK